jgi:hypothetical protein
MFSGVSLDNMPWKILGMQIIYTVSASLVIYVLLKSEKDKEILF